MLLLEGFCMFERMCSIIECKWKGIRNGMYDMYSWVIWEVYVWKQLWSDNEELAAIWTIWNVAKDINHISFILLVHPLKWAMIERKNA